MTTCVTVVLNTIAMLVAWRDEAEIKLRELAVTDALTSLPNRRGFEKRAQAMLAHARRHDLPLTALMLDLDHFKQVNDTHGHEVGDRALQLFSRLLKETRRDGDLAARLGGEEFCLLLHSDASAGAPLDQRLRQRLRQAAPAELGLEIDFSAGLAVLRPDDTSIQQLLARADRALYEAKTDGRGTHLFYAPYMLGQPAEALRQEHLLREAVLQDALRLHYQPQIEVSTGRLTGFEALVRWQHPERGLLGPDEFIPLAESRGLVTPIGRWVLREACRQIKAWQDEGLARVPVAVNVSAMEFRQRDLVGEIKQVLADTKHENLQGLLADVGLGNAMSVMVARRMLGDELPPEEQPKSSSKKMPIKGADGMLVTFANCCRPSPGDAIIAHISPGKGLVIHQEACRNIKGYSKEPDKYLPVQWEVDKEQEQEFRTGISIEIVNHQGALAELANVIAATGANIHAISTEEKDGRVYLVTLLITTKSRIHLANIMRKIRVMPNVLKVSRQKN